MLLLSTGTTEAKGHAATTIAQLARRADASSQIAEAGAVSAFVRWLADPSLGPPEVAARALSEIALDNPDTQAQIAEEAAISPLVDMVAAWKPLAAAPASPRRRHLTRRRGGGRGGAAGGGGGGGTVLAAARGRRRVSGVAETPERQRRGERERRAVGRSAEAAWRGRAHPAGGRASGRASGGSCPAAAPAAAPRPRRRPTRRRGRPLQRLPTRDKTAAAPAAAPATR